MAYIDTSIYTFQNSLKGLIQLSYSPNGCSLQFAPVFKPVSPKDIQPGMKIYNYQDAKYFTMDLGEAMTLAHILEEILTIMRLLKLGQYQGPVIPNHLAQQGPVTVDANRQSISVTHYPKQGMSVVSLVVDSKNPFVWYFNYNLIQNKQSVFSVSLAIKEHDLYLLKEYFKGLITYKASYAAEYRLQYDQNQQNRNTSNTSDNGNRNMVNNNTNVNMNSNPNQNYNNGYNANSTTNTTNNNQQPNTASAYDLANLIS